jgi:hypothetical protein
MTPEERAQLIYEQAVAADAGGTINSALHMLAARTVHEVLTEDHIGMERMIADRLRAALRTSLADAVTYLWDHRSFGGETEQPDSSLPFFHLRRATIWSCIPHLREVSMTRKTLAALSALTVAAAAGALAFTPAAGAAHRHGYEPVLNPANFVRKVTNPYFPLPVGRTLIYKGIKDGTTQVDRVHIMARTRVLEGIRAVAVSDVATHNGRLLEKTTDWYAQDKQGNVWYLGEQTAAYSHGHVDHSGSWLAGVHDGEPGIVMKAKPQIPDAYRQEFLAGQAQDTAWIVNRGGSFKLPFKVVHNVITSYEFTVLEPTVLDKKIYAPGLGIVMEEAALGPKETATLVSVHG